MSGNYKGQKFDCIPKGPVTKESIDRNQIQVTLDDGLFGLIIMADEVARMEKLYPELIGSTPQQDILIDDPYLIGKDDILNYFITINGKKVSWSTFENRLKAAGFENEVEHEDSNNKFSKPKVKKSVIRAAINFHNKKNKK